MARQHMTRQHVATAAPAPKFMHSTSRHGMKTRSQGGETLAADSSQVRTKRKDPPAHEAVAAPSAKRIKLEHRPSTSSSSTTSWFESCMFFKREPTDSSEGSRSAFLPGISSSRPDKRVAGPSNPRHHPQASLLGLPGELRNRIFRMALLEPDLILINGHNSEQPGILRTSRQLRREGRGIFEQENSFFVEAWDLKLRIPPNTEKHWLLDLNYKISLKGLRKWSNLRDWLHEYYECNLRGLADGQPTHWSKLVQRSFAQVDLLRKEIDNWAKIEKTLENWKLTSELSGIEWD